MNTDDRLFSDWTNSSSSHSRSRTTHSMNPHTNFNQSSMYPLGSQWNMASPHNQSNMPGSNPMSSRMLNSGLHQGLGLSYNPIMPYSNTYNSSNPTMHPSMNLPSGSTQNQFGMTETVQRGRDVMPTFPSMSSTHSPYLSQNESTSMQDFPPYRYNSASDPLNTNRLMHSDFITSERRSLSRASSNTSALEQTAQMGFPLEQSQMTSGSRSHLTADTSFMSRSQQPFDLPTRSDAMGFSRSDYSTHMAGGRSFGGLGHTASRQTDIPTMSYSTTSARGVSSVAAATAMEKSMTSSNQSFWSSQPANTATIPVTETTMSSSQRDKTPYFPVTQSLPGSAPVPRGSYGATGNSSYSASRPSGQGSSSNVASPQSTYSQSMTATTITTTSPYTASTPARSQTAYSHMSPATTSGPSTPLATAPPPTTTASSMMPTNKPQKEQDSTSMPGSNQSYSMAPRTPATPSFTSGYSPTFTTATTATTTMSPYPAPRSNDSVTSGNYRGPSSVQSTASNQSAAIQQKTQVSSSPLQDTHVSDGIKAADIPLQTEIIKMQATPEKMSPDDGASGLPPFTDVMQTLERTISRLPQASPGQSSEIQQAMSQLKLLMSMQNSLSDTLSVTRDQSSTDKMEAQSSSENSEDEQKEEMLFKEGVRRPVDLPKELTLKIDEQLQISVWAKQDVPVDTEFGPYQGRLTMKFMPAETRDKWLVVGPDYTSVALFQPLDNLEAELPPTWIRYISPGSSYQDQNCVLVKTENTRYIIKVVRDIGPNQELVAIHTEDFTPEVKEIEEIVPQVMTEIEERIEERRPSESSMPQLEAEEDMDLPDEQDELMIPDNFDSGDEEEEDFHRKRELSDEEESPRKSKRRKLLAAEPDVPADIGLIDTNDIMPEEPKEEKVKRKSRKKKKEMPPEREESGSASESRTPSPVKTERKRRSRRDKVKLPVEEKTEEPEDSEKEDSSPALTPQKEKKREKKKQSKSESPDKRESSRRKKHREPSVESKPASEKESEPEASDDDKETLRVKKEREESDKKVKRKWTHREFTCEVCGETIRYVTKFDRHMMEKHGINEPWKCEHCPTERKFRLYATLEKHVLTIHPDVSLSFEKIEPSSEKKPLEPETKTKRSRKSRKSKTESAETLSNKVNEEKIEDEVEKMDNNEEMMAYSGVGFNTKYEEELAELHKTVKKLKTKSGENRESSTERKKESKDGTEKKRRKSKKDKTQAKKEPAPEEIPEPEKPTWFDTTLDDNNEDDNALKKLDYDSRVGASTVPDMFVDKNEFSDEDSSPLSKLRNDDRLSAMDTKEENAMETSTDVNAGEKDDDDSDDGEKDEKGEKSSPDALKKKRKHRKLSFTCEECNEMFKWTTKYMKHMSEMHGVSKPFKCEKCDDIAFGTHQNYERHCQSKHDPNNSSSNRRAWTKHHFTCEVCGENIVHATKFDKHMFEKHGVVKPWKCNQCNQAFRLLSSLRNHINYVHEQIARPKSGKARDSTYSPSSGKDIENADKAQPFDVDVLRGGGRGGGGGIDNDDVSEDKFVKKEENDSEVENGKSSDKDSRVSSEKDDTTSVKEKKKKKGSFKKSGGKTYITRQFTCHICDESIVGVAGFEKHMLDGHQVDHCWQCSLCSTSPFRLFHGLQQHMKNMHSVDQESKTVLCELCGRSFKSEENLKRHMRIHLDTNPIKCSFCEQCFTSQTVLQKHMDKEHSSHPDAFKCETCLKVHTSQEDLEQHKDNQQCVNSNLQCGDLKTDADSSPVVYRDIRERVQCKHCDIMVLKQDIDDHENTHTGNKPHECSECGKGFAHRAGLNLHLKQVHNEDKNYKCDICSKAFKLKSYLRQHMVTHSSEKPHVCSICGKGFTRKAFMKKHERRHQENKDGEDDKEEGKEDEESRREHDGKKGDKEETNNDEGEKDDTDDKSEQGGEESEDTEKSKEHKES